VLTDRESEVVQRLLLAPVVFRSLAILDRVRIVRESIHPRQAEPEYRRMGANRWSELGLPGSPSDHNLQWIEHNVPSAIRNRAIACRMVGLCLVGSNTYEVLSGGLDATGHPLVRMQTGSTILDSKTSTFHVWLQSEGEGRVDTTDEQIPEFMPAVRHDEGRPTGRQSLLFIQRGIPLDPPMNRYRISKTYLPTFDNALVRLGLLSKE